MEFFCILNLTSFESYFVLSRVCWYFWRWLCCEGTSYIIWIFKFGYNLLCSTNHEKRRSTFSFKLFFFFFSRGRYCDTICRLFSDQMRCAMDWPDLKRTNIKNERIKLNVDDDNIVMKLQKLRTQYEIN